MSDAPEKKGLFARISDAFYEKVETDEGPAAPAARPAGGPPKAAAPHGPAVAGAAPAQEKPENPADIAARLRDQVAARGPAFSQFLALVASFAEIIPDEAGRYRAAMKALEKTGNVTRDQVLLAGKDQLQALDSQRSVFAEAVDRRRQALQQSGGAAERVRAQIAELERSLAALREQEQAMVKAAAAEEGRIKAAEEAFATLLGSVQDEITAAREKARKYLA
jgi:hypothetical protein